MYRLKVLVVMVRHITRIGQASESAFSKRDSSRQCWGCAMSPNDCCIFSVVAATYLRLFNEQNESHLN